MTHCRSHWLVALPLGFAVGCVGEPFIEHTDALQSSVADAGAEGAELPANPGTPGVETQPGVDGPQIPVDIAVGPSNPALGPSAPVDPSSPAVGGDGLGGTDGLGSVEPVPAAPAPEPLPSGGPVPASPGVGPTPVNAESGGDGDGEPPVSDGPAGPCVECSPAGCGNGVPESGEECDDGNTVSGDACNHDCTSPRCGDGFASPGEECDDGNGVDDDGCTNLCTLPRCGDGIVSFNEGCEDGNLADGDGCSAACQSEFCGDGIVSMNEDCDDGGHMDGDGCSSNCAAEVCGDGQTTPNEECDDGNMWAGDGCSPSCLSEYCGDGTVQSPREQCDDGNDVDSDLCRNSCTHPASLNSLSGSCAFVDQITQTVCMVATASWCNQFGHYPIAGLVTGKLADNEYTVGCIVGFQRKEVSTSKLDQCPGGRQQSPSCLGQVNAACNELGYDRGFYLGVGSAANTYAVACDYGAPVTASVPGCNGIADTNPVPVSCSGALRDTCGEGKGGLVQGRAQSNQVTYTCVDLSLTGSVRQF